MAGLATNNLGSWLWTGIGTDAGTCKHMQCSDLYTRDQSSYGVLAGRAVHAGLPIGVAAYVYIC